jgi:hypothetical protein
LMSIWMVKLARDVWSVARLNLALRLTLPKSLYKAIFRPG